MVLKKKLLKIIHNYFPEADMDSKKWNEIIDNAEHNPSTFHLLNSVKYYVTYYLGNNAINLSIVLYVNKKPAGILPLFAHQKKDKKWILSTNGIEIVEPIFIKTLGEKVRKKLEIKILNLIFDLSRELKIDKCQFANMELSSLSKWHIKLLEGAHQNFLTYHHIIDLSLSIENIKLKFRKSFKPLINKGLREWKVQVKEKVTEEEFDKFRLLHKSVVGKSTRSIESWKKQKKQVDDGEAFIVIVLDKKDYLLGAGFFTHTKNLGRYSVGVYRLGYNNLGHIVQMKAIETLKSKGLNYYEMGSKYIYSDKSKTSEKELSISFFLEGFSTNVFARQHLIIKVPN